MENAGRRRQNGGAVFFGFLLCDLLAPVRCSLGFTIESEALIKIADLKSDRPTVQKALQRLERELAVARQQRVASLKLIHGYGSTGAGGDIRIAVGARLQQLLAAGQIRGCIHGEDWRKSDEQTWRLLQTHPTLKEDEHLGRGNRGITIVVL